MVHSIGIHPKRQSVDQLIDQSNYESNDLLVDMIGRSVKSRILISLSFLLFIGASLITLTGINLSIYQSINTTIQTNRPLALLLQPDARSNASHKKPSITPITNATHEQQLAVVCMGFGVDLIESVESSISQSIGQSLNETCAAQSKQQLINQWSPILSSTYPGILTHRPKMNCTHGTYLVIDWLFTDGIGNSMWSRALTTSVAMALNATIVHHQFISTHIELEGHDEREERFRLAEWEINEADWKACPDDSPVKKNQWTTEKGITWEWNVDNEDLWNARRFIRKVQSEQAKEAGTEFMNQSIDQSNVLFFFSPSQTPKILEGFPRVDHFGPGLTIHLKNTQAVADRLYKVGYLPPAAAVAPIFEMRYLVQNDAFRAQLFPQDLIDPSVANLIKPVTNAITQQPNNQANKQSIVNRSWLSSHTIHVALPVRRGDVTHINNGDKMLVKADLRNRAMSNEAILGLVRQTIGLIRSINDDGQQLFDRLMFTVYSEGDESDFVDFVSALHAMGLRSSQVRLLLNGKPSLSFNLLIESDLIFMAPSAFSYASTCYFNTESLKIGAGWQYSRFHGCRNHIYAHWTWYRPTDLHANFTAEDLPPQTWMIAAADEIKFQNRFIRLVERKDEQRRNFRPIVMDNWYRRINSETDYYDRQEPTDGIRV